MSLDKTLDPAYRLHPADLTGGAQILTISAISLQGLEQVQPVAHFIETRKRLLLSPDHCRTLVLLTGSTLADDWVGTVVALTAESPNAYAGIRILPPADPSAPRRRLIYRWKNGWAAFQNQVKEFQSRLRTPDNRSTNALARQDRAPSILMLLRPVLVIALLSVVSFFLARAYGAAWIQMVQTVISGNGG